MDRQLPPDVINRRRRRHWLAALAIPASLFILFWLIRQIGTRSMEWSRIKYSVAEYGDVEATLNAAGTVFPETEQAITSPINSVLRRTFLRPGDRVEVGQPILELDKDDLQIEFRRAKDELELLRQKRTASEKEQERKLTEMNASREVKDLQAQFVKIQYERFKRLYEIGASSEEELQRAALASEIAARELSVLDLQIENQRTSMQLESQSLLLQVHHQENILADLSRCLVEADAPSKLEGIITWVNDSIGYPVREGDILARVADLKCYRMQGEISSINSSLISPGQTVHIRIAEKIIDGRIRSISPLVQNGVTIFDVQLDNPGNEILRPNLRADIFVVTSSVDDVVRVANGPFYEGLHAQVLFVLKGDLAEARRADIGAANFDWVEIRGDISPGDTVIVSDMKKYRESSVIKIKNRK